MLGDNIVECGIEPAVENFERQEPTALGSCSTEVDDIRTALRRADHRGRADSLSSRRSRRTRARSTPSSASICTTRRLGHRHDPRALGPRRARDDRRQQRLHRPRRPWSTTSSTAGGASPARSIEAYYRERSTSWPSGRGAGRPTEIAPVGDHRAELWLMTVVVTGAPASSARTSSASRARDEPEAQMTVLDKLTYAWQSPPTWPDLERPSASPSSRATSADPAAGRDRWMAGRTRRNFAAETHVDRSILDAGAFIGPT